MLTPCHRLHCASITLGPRQLGGRITNGTAKTPTLARNGPDTKQDSERSVARCHKICPSNWECNRIPTGARRSVTQSRRTHRQPPNIEPTRRTRRKDGRRSVCCGADSCHLPAGWRAAVAALSSFCLRPPPSTVSVPTATLASHAETGSIPIATNKGKYFQSEQQWMVDNLFTGIPPPSQ